MNEDQEIVLKLSKKQRVKLEDFLGLILTAYISGKPRGITAQVHPENGTMRVICLSHGRSKKLKDFLDSKEYQETP